jgi:Uma2 family endonuclease
MTLAGHQQRHDITLPRWQPAAWENYVQLKEDPSLESAQLFFSHNQLLVENRGGEGIQHARVSDLFRLLVGLWLMQKPDIKAEMMSNCIIQKPRVRAASPDLVVYVGEKIPQYQSGERREIDLDQQRPPDLVGEVSDTTLASDLDEKKKLYAEMGIREYWVIDVLGQRVFAFYQQPGSYYELIEVSVVLSGLRIELLSESLKQMTAGSNVTAATWFAQQLSPGETMT